MKNEFEKLDKFMAENRPRVSPTPLSKLPVSRSSSWTGVAVALGLSGIIAFGVIRHHQAEAESAALLSEVLSWDVTADEFPSEIDTELALLEY